jgi:hypothetical protein
MGQGNPRNDFSLPKEENQREQKSISQEKVHDKTLLGDTVLHFCVQVLETASFCTIAFFNQFHIIFPDRSCEANSRPFRPLLHPSQMAVLYCQVGIKFGQYS